VAVFERRAVLAEVWSSGVARMSRFPRILGLGYLLAADSVILGKGPRGTSLCVRETLS